MPDPAEHGVERPDREVVLPPGGERTDITREVVGGVVEPERAGRRVVDTPASGGDVLLRDEGVGVGMAAVLIDQKRRMEDLECLVGVERDDDLRDQAELVVDERAQPPAVVERAVARAAPHEELEAGRAERVLRVDGEEAHTSFVPHRGLEPVFLGPRRRIVKAAFVLDPPHVADLSQVDMRRKRKRRSHGGKARRIAPFHGATPDHHPLSA
jgi:hypothetical protein